MNVCIRQHFLCEKSKTLIIKVKSSNYKSSAYIIKYMNQFKIYIKQLRVHSHVKCLQIHEIHNTPIVCIILKVQASTIS